MTNANPGLRRCRDLDFEIQRRRRALGLTQADLAARIGWSQSSVARAERRPLEWLRVGDLVDLAHALEVEPAGLLPSRDTADTARLLSTWPARETS